LAPGAPAFAETVAGGPSLLAISYVPGEGCFYRGEDPFNLFPQLAGLRALRIFFRDPPVALAETDPFHSALVFRAWVGQPRSEAAVGGSAAVLDVALALPATNASVSRVDLEDFEKDHDLDSVQTAIDDLMTHCGMSQRRNIHSASIGSGELEEKGPLVELF
jgi:hypothetical protein